MNLGLFLFFKRYSYLTCIFVFTKFMCLYLQCIFMKVYKLLMLYLKFNSYKNYHFVCAYGTIHRHQCSKIRTISNRKC